MNSRNVILTKNVLWSVGRNMGEQDPKRKLILKATWRLIRHYGYAKTTISDIAREAGIGKGTVYLYFSSKTDIMLALVDETNERITEQLEEIAAEKTTPEKRLRKCLLHRVMTIFDIVKKYPHGEDVITPIKPEIVKRIDRHVKKQGEILGRIIHEGIKKGDFRKQDHKAAGLLLANLFEHFTPPYWRRQTRRSLEEFASGVVDMVIKGLKKR